MKINLLIIALLLFVGLRWDVIARALDWLDFHARFWWWLATGGCRGWLRYWFTRKFK